MAKKQARVKAEKPTEEQRDMGEEMPEGWDTGEPYEPKPGAVEVAGFELCGWRQPDGTILLGASSATSTRGTALPDFPKEVEAFGNVYTLERIIKNTDASGKVRNGCEWGDYC